MSDGASTEEPRSVFRRVDVLGVELSAVDQARTVDLIIGWAERDEHQYVCAVDVNSLMHAHRNSAVRDALNGAGVATADGTPLAWAMHYAGCPEAGRVAGPRLMPAVCRVAAQRGMRMYFLGGEPGVAEKVAAAMASHAPNLVVAGTKSPPFRELTPDEDAALVAEINEADPDVLWVALGAPKQELWMASHRGRVKAPVMVGVGGAFAVHAGLVREAPAWLQPTGLEWTYRLLQEPRRLARRYLRSHPAYVLAILRQRPARVTGGGAGSIPAPPRA